MEELDNTDLNIDFEDDWTVRNSSYNIETEYLIESYFAQGNGYMVSRAVTEETATNRFNYSGNYIVGLYNKALHVIGGQKIERDEIVNLPNWWQINFRISNNSWFDINKSDIKEFNRKLCLKNGLLEKEMLVKDKVGHLTRISSKRIVNFKNPNVFAQEYTIEPLNYSGNIKLKTSLNGNVYNERDLKVKHLYVSEKSGTNNAMYMAVETLKSNNSVFIYNQLEVLRDGEHIDPDCLFFEKEREVSAEIEVELKEKQRLTLYKLGYIKKQDLVYNVRLLKEEAKESLKPYKQFNQIVTESSKAWNQVWEKLQFQVSSNDRAQAYLNFYQYHLMISISENTQEMSTGFPSYSVQMEKNRGLAGWEEMFVLPFMSMRIPEISKKLIQYRLEHLKNAIENAASYKAKGALFPWKSGMQGNEQSLKEIYGPELNSWNEDYGYLQRHINNAVAFNIIQYLKSTNDNVLLSTGALETLINICRFWADAVDFDRSSNRYNINGVIGPDEFHVRYPTATKLGINNNAYTNFMVVWVLSNTLNLIETLTDAEKQELIQKHSILEDELERWDDISMFMKIEISDDEIIEQFSGFFKLTEIDWSAYKRKYPELYNINNILNTEGKKINDFQISQQADALLPFYFLTPEEIREIMLNTGYLLEKGFLSPNFHFYFKRTPHSSILSKPVHAMIALHNNDSDLSYQLFYETLEEITAQNYQEMQVRGINMGVAGALMNVVQSAYAGIGFLDDGISIAPALPKSWDALKFYFQYQGQKLLVEINKETVILDALGETPQKLKVKINGKDNILNKHLELKYR